MSPLVVEHFYYIVQDDKIVGRYGTSLNDALGHLRLYGKSKNGGPNRAIIQVLRNRAQLAGTGLAPPRSSRISNEEESLLLEVKEYCYWEDDQVLENMMKIVETEHEIIMPSNHQKLFCSSSTAPISTHPALTLSSEDSSRETVRKACYAYFVRRHREEYEQRNTSHLVLEEEEECILAMDATTRKKRKSCDHTTSSNHAATIAAGSTRMKVSRPSKTAAPTSTHTAH
jgi:hypothetical protein